MQGHEIPIIDRKTVFLGLYVQGILQAGHQVSVCPGQVRCFEEDSTSDLIANRTPPYLKELTFAHEWELCSGLGFDTLHLDTINTLDREGRGMEM